MAIGMAKQHKLIRQNADIHALPAQDPGYGCELGVWGHPPVMRGPDVQGDQARRALPRRQATRILGDRYGCALTQGVARNLARRRRLAGTC